MTQSQKTTNMLFEALDRNGLTLADLARATNLAKSTISRYVLGKQEPSVGAALRIAKVFQEPVEAIWMLA